MADETPTPITQVVLVGLPEEALEIVRKVFAPEMLKIFPYDIEVLMELGNTMTPALVCCGPTPEGISQIEIAQMFRMQFQETSTFYITTQKKGFESVLFKKNGFTDAFLLPLDADVLAISLRDELSKATKGKAKSFRSVKLLDITPDATLNFDTYIYLPANRKHIKYTEAGGSMDSEQTERLKKYNFSNIQVEKQQMKQFYEYTAEKLKSIQGSDSMSETEKKEKLQGAIRDIMGNMFSDSAQSSSFEAGKQVVADCQEIVKSYVMSSTNNKLGWYTRLLTATGSSLNSYSHAANVSTYGALFSLGIGMGSPENIALAGLLHDIGKADIPAEIQTKFESEMTPEELEVYKKHVEFTLNMIKNRKLVVNEAVLKIISQHHERYDGRGYPKGVEGNRIVVDAQILAIADHFDYLTAAVEGRPSLTPAQGVQKLYDLVASDPVNSPYNPEIIKKIVALFKPEEAPQAQTSP